MNVTVKREEDEPGYELPTPPSAALPFAAAATSETFAIDRQLAPSDFFGRICLVKVGGDKLRPALRYDSVSSLQSAVEKDVKVSGDALSNLQRKIFKYGRNGAGGVAYLLGRGKIKRSLVPLKNNDAVGDVSLAPAMEEGAVGKFYLLIDALNAMDQYRDDAEFRRAYAIVETRNEDSSSGEEGGDEEEGDDDGTVGYVDFRSAEFDSSSAGHGPGAVKDEESAAEAEQDPADPTGGGSTRPATVQILRETNDSGQTATAAATKTSNPPPPQNMADENEPVSTAAATKPSDPIQNAVGDNFAAAAAIPGPKNPPENLSQNATSRDGTGSGQKERGAGGAARKKGKAAPAATKTPKAKRSRRGTSNMITPMTNALQGADQERQAKLFGERVSAAIALDEPYNVMTNAEAWSVLQAKFGITCVDHYYCLPDQDKPVATTLANLRKDLCINGLTLPTQLTYSGLPSRAMIDIARWIRWTHVSGLVDGQCIQPEDFGRPIEKFMDGWTILNKFGCKWSGGKYTVPTSPPGSSGEKKTFDATSDVERHFAWFGIQCLPAQIPEEILSKRDRLSLEVFFASPKFSVLNTFERIGSGCNSSRKRKSRHSCLNENCL